MDAGGIDGGVACGAGLTQCSSGCVNTANDRSNCGGCGVACAANESCQSSTCIATPDCRSTPCPNGYYCDLNDGNCLAGCAGDAQCAPPTTSCANHQCACPDAGSVCAGVCVELSTDPSNCGACGQTCASPNTCSGGACYPTCWQDGDGDGFTSAVTMAMTAASCPAGWLPQPTALDCDDTNPEVFPGQPMYFANPTANVYYDYNCDGSFERAMVPVTGSPITLVDDCSQEVPDPQGYCYDLQTTTLCGLMVTSPAPFCIGYGGVCTAGASTYVDFTVMCH